MKRIIDGIKKWIKNLKYLIWDKGLKPIFVLLQHDFKTTRKNMAALIIVLGLCLLPSLYAWINIYASWDPYANTGNLPVAIVNNDNGAVFNGEVINVGENIIDEMKENTSINWHFVDQWQGNYGLNDGRYYAMIEIPSNFSERLTSLGTSTPRKPAIIYKANEKLNAIAAKITNVAKDKLVNNIRSNFVKTVNEEIFETFNESADKSDADSITLDDLKTDLKILNEDIKNISNHLENEKGNDRKFQAHLRQTSERMDQVQDRMKSLQAIMRATSRLKSARTDAFTQKIETLNTGLSKVQTLNEKNEALIDTLIAINENTIDEDFLSVLSSTNNICTELEEQLDENIESLETLDPDEDNNSVQFTISSLTFMQKLVTEERDKLLLLASTKKEDDKKEMVEDQLYLLKDLSGAVSQRSGEIQDFFETTLTPTINALSSNMVASLNDTADLVEALEVATSQYRATSKFVIATRDLSSTQKTRAIDLLTDLNEDIEDVLDRLNDVDEEKLTKLYDLIRDNPTEITDFLAEPLDVEVIELYEVEAFGIAITPFYTVLAIWVGALLISSILSVNSHWNHGYSMGHVHISKMIFFLIISMIQSLIIVMGDIAILGVAPKDPGLMFVFAILTSVTFVAIIFTLASVFGNVGKAIAIVIMIFQIAGSGGIYPIETNPEIFGVLQPLWPFTYAIGGFREAILGPAPEQVTSHIHALLKVIVVVLPFGLLKKPMHPLIHFFEEKFEESDLK